MTTQELYIFLITVGAAGAGIRKNADGAFPAGFVNDPDRRLWRRVTDRGAARLVASQLQLFQINPSDPVGVISRTARPAGQREFFVTMLPKERPGSWGPVSIPLSDLVVYFPALERDPGITAMLGRLPGIDAETLANEGAEAARQVEKSRATNAKAEAKARSIQSFNFERDVLAEGAAGLGRVAGSIVSGAGSIFGASAGAFLGALSPVAVVGLSALAVVGVVVAARRISA
jgi:hypothetical protein